MSTKYRNLITPQPTPQSEQAHPAQVKNSAGGYAFQVSKWDLLMRFLILGSDAPTYYASARKLTAQSAKCVNDCLAEDYRRTIDTIVEVSQSGRAVKNEPALFALAMAASFGVGEMQGTPVRQYALDQLPKVARTGTHLFHFADYVDAMRGWGRGLRNAIANWYLEADNRALAYQVTKYKQRDGWSHRDLLRKSHPNTNDPEKDAIFAWVADKGDGMGVPLIAAHERAKVATTEREIVNLIVDGWLTREMIPTQWLNSVAVWEALLEKMPMTAMVRNLGKMSAVGLLKPLANATKQVTERLADADYIRKSRLHPLSILVAMNTYANGGGVRGSLSWKPVAGIVAALDGAFYKAFDFIAPTGKRMMLALDVSGSMSFSGEIAGMPGITPRVGSAAMAMTTARVEENYMTMAFTQGFVQLNIHGRMSLQEAVRAVSGLPFGGTDCAQPMLHAAVNGIAVDTFVVYTDNETWAGRIHPYEALQAYRESTGIPAKLVVVGMVANKFTIADPNDAGMLDVVGFDTRTPSVISNFSAQGMEVEF
jgi:60 kDa SS-A/Ro ribonucleoprotein